MPRTENEVNMTFRVKKCSLKNSVKKCSLKNAV